MPQATRNSAPSQPPAFTKLHHNLQYEISRHSDENCYWCLNIYNFIYIIAYRNSFSLSKEGGEWKKNSKTCCIKWLFTLPWPSSGPVYPSDPWHLCATPDPNTCSLVDRVGIQMSHLGPCNNISAHRENCPVSCDQAPVDGPICGSDGNVYKNTCQMKLLTCGWVLCHSNRKYRPPSSVSQWWWQDW